MRIVHIAESVPVARKSRPVQKEITSAERWEELARARQKAELVKKYAKRIAKIQKKLPGWEP